MRSIARKAGAPKLVLAYSAQRSLREATLFTAEAVASNRAAAAEHRWLRLAPLPPSAAAPGTMSVVRRLSTALGRVLARLRSPLVHTPTVIIAIAVALWLADAGLSTRSPDAGNRSTVHATNGQYQSPNAASADLEIVVSAGPSR